MTLLECLEMSSSKQELEEIHLQVLEVDLVASLALKDFKTSSDKEEEAKDSKALETYSKNLRNSLVEHSKEEEVKEDKAWEEDNKVEILFCRLKSILWMQ